MSDEQLDETSISQGHGTFGICDEMRMLMCEFEESDFEISGSVFTGIRLGSPVQRKEKN